VREVAPSSRRPPQTQALNLPIPPSLPSQQIPSRRKTVSSPYAPKAIAAVIVGVLAPLILAFATFIANGAQTRFDKHLEGAALAVYITGFLIVSLAAIIKLAEHVASVLVADALKKLASKQPASGAAVPGGGKS
jgi:hypothetical protein